MTHAARRTESLNVHAERSRLTPAQLARWRGLPVAWVDAGATARDQDFEFRRPVLALLDTGQAQAHFDFGRGTRSHELSAGAMGLFDGRPCRLSDWVCRSVRRIMIDLDVTGFGEPELLHGARQDLEFRDPDLASVLRAIAHEIDAGSPNGTLFAESLSVGVLRRVAALHGRVQPESGALTAGQLRRVDELIAAGAASDLSLSSLAGATGYSKAQFVRLFRRATGTSPHRYVLRRRLDRALQLIVGSSMPLAEVADECGFSSQSHLSSAFAGAYRCTPGEARRNARR